MRVRQDVALARDDKARSLRSRTAAVLGMCAEERDNGDHPRGALTIDLRWVEIVPGEGFPARVRIHAVGCR